MAAGGPSMPQFKHVAYVRNWADTGRSVAPTSLLAGLPDFEVARFEHFG